MNSTQCQHKLRMQLGKYTDLESVSTLGAPKHFNVPAGRLNEVEHNAGRGRTVSVTIVPVGVGLVSRRYALSVAFNASGKVYIKRNMNISTEKNAK